MERKEKTRNEMRLLIMMIMMKKKSSCPDLRINSQRHPPPNRPQGLSRKNATEVTPEISKTYNITTEDYFTIIYKETDHLLKAFKQDLTSSLSYDAATNHVNNVKLIWKSLSPTMEMLPKNALGNLHLLRHKYHIPQTEKMGTKKGVQHGTLRARYTSLSHFIDFLRSNQIFAGMSRQCLHMLEEQVGAFTKKLNPSIKQRKIDVRREKVRSLLLSRHFIAYGRSKHVQKLIWSSKKPSQFVRKSKAIQMRDYLITTLVIGNGLRASNVINLTIKDIKEAVDDPQYEGHKVITNSLYKTSTIYGEKFIVIPNDTFRQINFYIDHLRQKINSTKSTKLFLPNSCKKRLSATNVSSSLTASFKRANVLSPKEKSRICCTRIRCGIATYACNEGGMEMAYFAKHFMKNKEETTGLHYNLLSNRRHALNIAMRLYKSFSGPDETDEPIDRYQDELADEIKNSTKSISSVN